MTVAQVSQQGFTIIELLITIFIIGTVVTGIFGLFVLGLRSGQEGERRVVAIALANERAEMVRNLPYVDVGTVSGIPAGNIAPEENIVRNNVNYTVKTDIRYIDDPFDGTAGGTPPDLLNADYKQARIEVTWNSPAAPKPLVLIQTITPPGLEGGEIAGTLDFQALNAAGQGVAQAVVNITNTTVDPPVDFTTSTDETGRLILPGLPVAADSYELTVTKSGYITEQTYTPTATFTPDSDHVHLSMLQGQITPKTFLIDQVSSLTITTRSEDSTVIGAVSYTLRGSKSHGTDADGQPVYLIDVSQQTNASGTSQLASLPWDSYEFDIDEQATGYDIKETSLLLPLVVSPNETLALDVVLVPHTPQSLHITVVSPDGLPIDNATVQLTQGAYDTTLGTGAIGQVFFADLPATGDYNLLIDAPGFVSSSTSASITGTTRQRITLTPTL